MTNYIQNAIDQLTAQRDYLTQAILVLQQMLTGSQSAPPFTPQSFPLPSPHFSLIPGSGTPMFNGGVFQQGTPSSQGGQVAKRGPGRPPKTLQDAPQSIPERKKPEWTTEAREKARARMAAYWEAKRAEAAKTSKAAKGTPPSKPTPKSAKKPQQKRKK